MSTYALNDVLGPRGRTTNLWLNAASTVAIAAILGWLLWRLADNGQLTAEAWSATIRPDVLKLFGVGLLSTLSAAGTAMAVSLLLGLVLAAGRLSNRIWLRIPARAAVELFRGLPVLLLIFLIYLGLPALGIVISAFWSLVLGISLYNGAFIAEIYRAGILALPRGQTEAAAAIGLTPRQTTLLILLPQAVRTMLPALIVQLVVIVKESSLGFIVGYTELLRNANGAVHFLGTKFALPLYVEIAVVYIVLNLLLSMLARYVERRTSRRSSAPSPVTVEVE
jgi:glutamate transport system permease protein